MPPHTSAFRHSVFLTGATGFVGQYLLKEALTTELPVAVLVRPDGRASGQSRIEAILQGWEERLGRKLVRPVVIEGCLREQQLGLSRADRSWLQRRCSTVLHSAASVTFDSSEGSSEPWQTNVEGTRHLLDICDTLGLREFHHVSTAYVCGLRSGRILEAELDVNQVFGNDYERSKVEAERLVRQAEHLHAATIYRPSIVVGDSHTGHTTSFRGLYAPLQLIYLYAQWNPRRELPLLSTVGLTGDEEKNLVPVDWVARMIRYLMRCPDAAGQTFHLTNPQPTRICDIMDAVQTVVAASCGKDEGETSAVAAGLFEDGGFRQHLNVYSAYLRSDPEFDGSTTAHCAPNDRCPAMDREQLVRMVGYAIEQRFTTPRARVKVASAIEPRLRAAFPDVSPSNGETDDWLQLELSGPGGGAWQIGFRDTTPVCLDRGMVNGATASAYGSTETFCSLLDARITPLEAVARGVLVIRGQGRPAEECLRLITGLQTTLGGETLRPVDDRSGRMGEPSHSGLFTAGATKHPKTAQK